ncbi:MAG: MarP family serine protease [Actinomycetota bacterium]|nr:MarP family serine protease [Actinomycetota bacterium]
MNLFDLLLIVVLVGAGVAGYRLGFVARVTSWIGLALGILTAAWLTPKLQLDTLLQAADPATRLIVVGAAFLVIASLGGALGAAAGMAVQRVIPFGSIRKVDQAGGAAAGLVGAIILLWLLIPAVAEVPGTIARQARNSTIARALDKITPRVPTALQDLRQQVRDANFPQVFDQLRPAPDVGPPPANVALSAAVQQRVKDSTVRVSGAACGRVLEGSGFSPEEDTIVTNAHVVAGVRSPSVLRPDGRKLAAQVQVFDPARDLAVLSVKGLGQSPLSVGSGTVDEDGAVFGHPNGQVPVEIAPARIRSRITAVGRDLYNRNVTRRDIYILASRLAPGDSGGALVNVTGTVVGVAFAIAPDQPGTAYALTDKELRPVLAQPRGATVSTGDCIGG